MTSRQYFDKVAPQWDRMRQTFFSEAVREKAIFLAGVRPGQLAADVGAGTGFITEGLIKRGLRVVAIDQSEAMLQELRRKYQSIDTVDYRVGDAERLPLEDEGVDYVFANMLLHHVENPPGAIKEMARILKPGGLLVITDLDEHTSDCLAAEHCDRWAGFKRENVQRWFMEAGLKGATVDCLDENCVCQSSSGDETANISIFIASGEK